MGEGESLVGGGSYSLPARGSQGLRSGTWGLGSFISGGWNATVLAVEEGAIAKEVPRISPGMAECLLIRGSLEAIGSGPPILRAIA